jgi:outer membrane protein TolC
MNCFLRRPIRYCIPLGLLLLSGDPGQTWARSPLSPQECIDLALEQNPQHLLDQQNLKRGHTSLLEARAPFGLQANLGLTLPGYSQRRETTELEALPTRVRTEDSDFSYTGNLHLEQRISHLGRFTIDSSGSRRDFTSNRREDFLDYNGDIVLGYTRPILTRAQEEINLNQAELRFANTRSGFERQRLQIEGQVIDAYYDLVQSIRRLEIEAQRLDQSRASLDLAQRKFEIGLIAEVDALTLEVALLEAEADYAAAETHIERQRDVLRQQLGVDLDEPLDVITEVAYQQYSISEERSLELGLERHAAIRIAEINEQIGELDLKSARQSARPTARLDARMSLRGQGSEIGDISRNFERNLWSMGIQIQVPLIDKGRRRSQLSRAKIALEESRIDRAIQRRHIILEIKNAVRGLREAERQIELGEARLEVAERTYEVQQRRFEMGQAESRQLLEAQIALTSARNAGLNSIILYQRRLVDLRLATMAELDELVE